MENKKFTTVKCAGCGEDKFTNPKAYAKRLKKYGSREEMEKQWLCRPCAKNAKAGLKQETTKADDFNSEVDFSPAEGGQDLRKKFK